MEMNEEKVFFMTKGRCGRSLDRKIIYSLKPTFSTEKWVVIRICDCIETWKKSDSKFSIFPRTLESFGKTRKKPSH